MTDVYDVLIVGAGIVGSALAHALSTLSSDESRPLNILLLERSLAEPQRIVGELFQPSGVEALRELGIEDALDDIENSIKVKGYGVVHSGRTVHIPYPAGYEGRSFHHGRFVQALRRKAKAGRGVQVVEATVTNLVECPRTKKITGVRARSKDGEHEYSADLTVVADGCFSNLRSKVIPDSPSRCSLKSHFIGLILQDVQLPYPQHGTVVLVPGSGPVLLYQIEKRETRILMDVKDPLPKDLKVCLVRSSLASASILHRAISLPTSSPIFQATFIRQSWMLWKHSDCSVCPIRSYLGSNKA
jgi:squalene monooxygenase